MMAILLAGCAEEMVDPELLGTDPVWNAETYGVTLLLHDGSTVRAGEACVGDTCATGTSDGRLWLEGLEAGDHVVELDVDGSEPTITAVSLQHDAYSRAASQVYEAGLVERFLPILAWQRATTGLVDLWVRDESSGDFGPMGGAVIEIDAGDVFVSGGGDAIADNVTIEGGPAWIANLPPGDVTLRVTAPGYVCRKRVIGWPVEGDEAAIRLPVEADTITTAWIGCTPEL